MAIDIKWREYNNITSSLVIKGVRFFLNIEKIHCYWMGNTTKFIGQLNFTLSFVFLEDLHSYCMDCCYNYSWILGINYIYIRGIRKVMPSWALSHPLCHLTSLIWCCLERLKIEDQVGSKVGQPRMGSAAWAHQTIYFHLGAAHLLGHWLFATNYGYWSWLLVTTKAISYRLLAMAIGYWPFIIDY